MACKRTSAAVERTASPTLCVGGDISWMRRVSSVRARRRRSLLHSKGKEREGRNKVLRSKGQCQCHSNIRRVKDERNTVMEHFCAHRMTQASVAPRRGWEQ